MIPISYQKTGFWIFAFLLCFSTAQASCIYENNVQAKQLQIGNMLEWSTIEEQDNQYFDIQRSSDGVDFESIGQVESKGNSQQNTNYQFLDTSIGNNRVFYRIKDQDSFGASSYSHIIIVHRSVPNNFVVESMSSTYTDKLFTLNISSVQNGSFFYQVLDSNRKIQLQENYLFGIGENTISIDLETLAIDKYIVVLKMKEEVEELLVQKVPSTKIPKLNLATKNN